MGCGRRKRDVVVAFAMLVLATVAWNPKASGGDDRGGVSRQVAYLTASDFRVDGLPQQEYHLDVSFANGVLQRVDVAGSVGFVIRPKGRIDASRRAVVIVPLWLALPSAYGNSIAKVYVESLLQHGFHVVGFDVGTSLGSPKAAKLFHSFLQHVTREFQLAPKTRFLAVSNGGLISYGYAFRYPKRVDRLLGIYPAVDFRSWPKMERVVGPSALTPRGLAYGLSAAEMKRRITSFNPIDNLEPLARQGVRLFHLHGDADELVPIDANSHTAVRRYRELGGMIRLAILPGRGHGGVDFFKDDRVVRFLVAP